MTENSGKTPHTPYELCDCPRPAWLDPRKTFHCAAYAYRTSGDAPIAEVVKVLGPPKGCDWCEGTDNTSALMQSAPGATDSEKVENLCTCPAQCSVAWCGRGPSDDENL